MGKRSAFTPGETLSAHPQSLEEKVYNWACRTSAGNQFDIGVIRLSMAVFDQEEYSYKQVRDALYRLRVKTGLFTHLLRGVYKWQSK